jgi:hypothetical protein
VGYGARDEYSSNGGRELISAYKVQRHWVIDAHGSIPVLSAVDLPVLNRHADVN